LVVGSHQIYVHVQYLFQPSASGRSMSRYIFLHFNSSFLVARRGQFPSCSSRESMSYLRPLHTDVVTRAVNHNFVSVYLPACLHTDSGPGVLENRALPKRVSPKHESTSAYGPDRVPSQRPIDRRWDESRGLASARRPRNALKDHAWCPRDGVVFATKHESRRTLHETRRPCAIRTLRPPPPPKEKTQSEPTAKAQARPAPPPVYGGALPSLSRNESPPPSATSGPKSSKWQEMERQIEKLKLDLKILKSKRTA